MYLTQKASPLAASPQPSSRYSVASGWGAAAPSPPPLRGWLASAWLPPVNVIIVW